MLAKVKVVVHNDGIASFLNKNKGVRDMLSKEAMKVKNYAQATASAAEKGPGGRIDGYAAAGFKIVWHMRGRRPKIDIIANADQETVNAVHFYTQKRDGVSHLRKALYSITSRR